MGDGNKHFADIDVRPTPFMKMDDDLEGMVAESQELQENTPPPRSSGYGIDAKSYTRIRR
jgi:hypothetical protein